MDNARELFGRYLDLSPLGKHASGLVTCIFHPDTDRPGHRSLSVDLDKGVFNCFGCGAQGGLRDFARLVGAPEPEQRQSATAPLATAWRRVFEQAEREGKWAETWRPLWTLNDVVRATRRLADSYRAAAHALGPDNPDTWVVAEWAAKFDREADGIEHDLEELIARTGRIPWPTRP